MIRNPQNSIGIYLGPHVTMYHRPSDHQAGYQRDDVGALGYAEAATIRIAPLLFCFCMSGRRLRRGLGRFDTYPGPSADANTKAPTKVWALV